MTQPSSHRCGHPDTSNGQELYPRPTPRPEASSIRGRDAEQLNGDGRTWVQHAFASHTRGECESADDRVEYLEDMDAPSHLDNLVQRHIVNELATWEETPAFDMILTPQVRNLALDPLSLNLQPVFMKARVRVLGPARPDISGADELAAMLRVAEPGSLELAWSDPDPKMRL